MGVGVGVGVIVVVGVGVRVSGCGSGCVSVSRCGSGRNVMDGLEWVGMERVVIRTVIRIESTYMYYVT